MEEEEEEKQGKEVRCENGDSGDDDGSNGVSGEYDGSDAGNDVGVREE